MSKSFIIFGRINKRLFLPFFACLIQVINVIINKFDSIDKNFFNFAFLYLIASSFGQLSVRLYPYILKISNKKDINFKISKKKKCLHYFILCLLFISDIGLGNISFIFENRNIESHLFPNNNLILYL